MNVNCGIRMNLSWNVNKRCNEIFYYFVIELIVFLLVLLKETSSLKSTYLYMLMQSYTKDLEIQLWPKNKVNLDAKLTRI